MNGHNFLYGPVEGSAFSFAISTFFTWNARFGEILFRYFIYTFGENIFQNQRIFGIFNTIVFIGLLINIFYLVKGRWPKLTIKDNSIIIVIFLSLCYSSFFNQVFIWSSGAFNYGWAIFFYSCFIIPYRHLFNNIINSPENSIVIFNNIKIDLDDFTLINCIKVLIFLIFSIPVGMGSIIITPPILITLTIILIYYIFIRLRVPPLWYFMGCLGLFIGWILLFTAPGPQLRNLHSEIYVSIFDQYSINLLKIL